MTSTNSVGTSKVWVQHVRQATAADLAREILHSRRITLAKGHVSGVRDGASALDDIRDVAAGHLASRSSYENGPGGAVAIDIRLLRALVAIGQVTTIEVSEVAGGSHAPNSDHYKGRAVDIDRVNGQSVGGGAGYGVVVRICRAHGASTIYDPGFDPYGGHSNHVHCGWR